jgi:hypothetical protein
MKTAIYITDIEHINATIKLIRNYTEGHPNLEMLIDEIEFSIGTLPVRSETAECEMHGNTIECERCANE